MPDAMRVKSQSHGTTDGHMLTRDAMRRMRTDLQFL